MANEKRLIDEFKNEVMSKFIELCRGNDYNKLTLLRIGDTIDRIYEKYSTMPTVEAAPVVHGWWMIAGRGIRACSECNHGIREHMACVNHYCPDCGAKMDGGVKNA